MRASEATRFITEMILQPAFDVSPEYTFRERLVSRVEYTRKSPFTLTYHIRPAARWSDGAQITAKDFLFTHQAIRKYRPDPEDPHLTHVRSVRALDSKTVRVVLRSRFSGWRSLFANVLPSHALQGEDLTKIWTDGIDDPRTGRAIGSGPFLFGSWERGRQLTLVRNPHYWGAHRAYLDRLVIRFRAGEREPRRLVPGWRARRCLLALPRCCPCASSGTRRKGACRAECLVPELRVRDRSRRTPRPTYGSSFAAPSPTPSTAPRSSRQALGRSNRTYSHSRACSSRPEPLLSAALERLPQSTGARQSPVRAGGLSEGRRRHLLVRGRAPLPSFRHGRWQPWSSADPVARAVAAQTIRCRGDDRPSIPRARSSRRSSRVATSTSRSPGSKALRIRPGTPPSDAVAARTSPVTASGS